MSDGEDLLCEDTDVDLKVECFKKNKDNSLSMENISHDRDN